MGQINLLISLTLIALFSIALISFAVNFAYDNDTVVNLEDDADFQDINSGMKSDVQQFYQDSNVSGEAMYQSTVNTQTDSTEGGTAFKVGTGSALSMVSRAVWRGYTKIFGSDSGFGIFITALFGIIGFMAFLYIWKSWRGQPD